MPLNDAATLVIDTGNYLTAPVDTVFPTDITAPSAPWSPVGHTSLEDIFSTTSEGGDPTVIGTLQKKQLRTRYSARTETLNFTLQQFDNAGLKLYYGANAIDLPNGLLAPHKDPVPTVAAFLAVFIDDMNVFAFYAPKAEIYRADDPNFGDTESLAGLPLGVKPLISGSNNWAYAVTPLGAIATGAKAGTPGDFTPLNAVHASNLAGMSGITASPNTAWTTGQYVRLADGTNAFWDGTTWKAGIKP